MSATVLRHRTAMERTSLSRPVALAVADGVIRDGHEVFDYGCGRGGDVRRLRALGFQAAGWDPTFVPDAPRSPADVVNLGFVVNVIERPSERAEALHIAWALARKTLVVAARLDWDARDLVGRPHADGLITAKGTFQKLYRQEELRAWLEASLGTRAIAAAPGVFYVFRDEREAHRYLANRVRTGSSYTAPQISEQVYQAHRDLFDELAEFFAARGRLPRDHEIPGAGAIKEELGSIPRAFAVLRRVTGHDQWQQFAEERRRDLLVYLALANFGGRPSFSQLPLELRFDVKDLFGTYKAAVVEADQLLFAAGKPAIVDTSARASRVGKLTPEALYVHVSALPLLPPVLRVYEGCGRALSGTVDEANVLKLHRQRAQVSYLAYPKFDGDAHPALTTVVIARLHHLDVTFRDFRLSTNPPVLHRKETFVADDYAGRSKFARLTEQEERAGLLDDSASIGSAAGWNARLADRGYRIAGHRLLRSRPDRV